ncbi:hypothetical protein PGB90_007682 [Kerria lacca]
MVQSINEKNIKEDTQKVAAEVQLQKYGSFFKDFESKLKINEKLLLHKRNFPEKQWIRIHLQTEEQIDTIQELINSENKIIDKVLTTFCKLCDEVTFLEYEAKTKYLDALEYYGEGLLDKAPYEDCQLLISKTLPLLQNLSNFVAHCERVIFDILCQLSAFYKLHFEITDANLYDVFDNLGRILLILIMLEETLSNNNTLIYHWSYYRRTVQVALHAASGFSINANKIRQLNNLLDRLESQLFAKKIFENFLKLNFEQKQSVQQNKHLQEEFSIYLRTLHNELDKMMNKQNGTLMTKLMKLSLIFILQINIFGVYEKKFLKNIADIIKKFPFLTLRSNVLIQLDKFIINHVGSLIKLSEKKMFEKDQEQCVKLYLNEITQRMNKDVQYYTSNVLSWLLKFENKLLKEIPYLKADYLEEICNVLIEGINFNRHIKILLTTVSNLHINANKPMYKTSAVSFCKLIELMKCVYSVYVRHQAIIFKLINYIIQYLQYVCLQILNKNKRNIGASNKRFKEIRVDAMSSLVIAENCLIGSPTRLRLTIITLCLNLANQAKCLNESDRYRLYEILNKLSIITSLFEKLDEVSECKFIYWNKNTLPLYLEDVTKKKLETNRMQYLLDALENGYVNLISHRMKFISANAEIIDAFTEYISQPISRKMEENLRLHALLYLQLQKRTLQQLNYELHNFPRAESLHFINKRFDLKFQVEIYLDRTFYDLTTVALHDWQIYGEMRTLAKRKFHLNVTDDGLPNHTLEQGPDLLEITRNIQIFVANHFYNLNNQIFIETSSNNKHLNVINIQHTANSIRTHGAGIMSTAVNYTYQFLRSKLNIFSQFLYDEQIKSRLLKEVVYFEEQKSNAKYSFEKAEKFYKSIRKLNTKGEVLTYIDQFRILITHVGNAMGYVRLIRSGGLRYFSNAIGFLPKLKGIADFEKLCKEETYSIYCKQAATNLNNVIFNMCHNITEGTNYFKLLIDVFSSAIEEPGNDHLKSFYMIIPTLTINFVENLIMAKEGLSKKNKATKVTFTDDGFAMGIAYLLHVLKLYSKFDSLQWFQRVNERNELLKQNIHEQIANTPKDDLNLNHTLNLSLKRLTIYQQEFQLLYYNLYSAQVLFQNPQKQNDDNED